MLGSDSGGAARGGETPSPRAGSRAFAWRWANRLHRWFGFTAGAVLLISGLTGILLSFYIEIERATFSSMHTDTPHARPSSYEDFYQGLTRIPIEPAGGVWRIEIPTNGGVITSRYAARGQGMRMVTVDPVTFKMLRDARWGQTFFSWIYDVHMNLKLGAIGRPVLGAITIGMIVMLIFGVANWLLQAGRLRTKLRFASGPGHSRFLYNIHVIVGLVSLVFLVFTLGTGVMMNFPAQVRTILGSVSTLTPTTTEARSTPMEGARRIPVDTAMRVALEHFPGAELIWVKVPVDPTDTYNLQLRFTDGPTTRWPRTQVWLDQYSGQVLDSYDARTDGVGDTILEWVIPLHEGLYWGMAGRVMTMLLGVASSFMFITGFLRWRQKRAKGARN